MQMQTFMHYILIYMHWKVFIFLEIQYNAFIFVLLLVYWNKQHTFWWKLPPVSMTHASRMQFLCNTSAISQTSTCIQCAENKVALVLKMYCVKSHVPRHYFFIWIEITFVVRACYCVPEWCVSNFMLTGLITQHLSWKNSSS